MQISSSKLLTSEKMLLTDHKKANMFKAKILIEKVGTRYLTGALITPAGSSWPPPLPFHTALKTPQPNIFTPYQHGSPSQTHCHSNRQTTHTHSHTHTLTHTLTHSLTHTHTHTLSLSLTHTHTHSHTHTHTHTHADRDMYKKAWICSAEEFLELYDKVDAVVRNCLLR